MKNYHPTWWQRFLDWVVGDSEAMRRIDGDRCLNCGRAFADVGRSNAKWTMGWYCPECERETDEWAKTLARESAWRPQ